MKRVARTRSEVRLTVTIAYTKVVVFDSEWKLSISFAEYGSSLLKICNCVFLSKVKFNLVSPRSRSTLKKNIESCLNL